jgi:hypothetical protein
MAMQCQQKKDLALANKLGIVGEASFTNSNEHSVLLLIGFFPFLALKFSNDLVHSVNSVAA